LKLNQNLSQFINIRRAANSLIKITTMSSGGKGKAGKGGKAAGAHKSVSRSHKAGLQFPVGRVSRYLK